ncbi:hypothetical protein LTR85_006537 [Meristemomyces frigidus]|nr:hypothetical protein LTR85_006537 [Meristemomyces frigidus]
MTSLPTPRQVVASLISAIPMPLEPQALSANPLTDVPEVKELLLTLHVLFPNELLPALDLLDRGLVTRLRLSQIEHSGIVSEAQARVEDGQQSTRASPAAGRELLAKQTAKQSTAAPTPCTYYVRSAQQQASRGNSRYRNAAYEHITYYEARLDAWSCSCPAFAFSAFPAASTDAHGTPLLTLRSHASAPTSSKWLFGGLTLGTDMPICKHLLACVLVEHSAMFAHFVEERAVSAEELAGWAAGWGD